MVPILEYGKCSIFCIYSFWFGILVWALIQYTVLLEKTFHYDDWVFSSVLNDKMDDTLKEDHQILTLYCAKCKIDLFMDQEIRHFLLKIEHSIQDGNLLNENITQIRIICLKLSIKGLKICVLAKSKDNWTCFML